MNGIYLYFVNEHLSSWALLGLYMNINTNVCHYIGWYLWYHLTSDISLDEHFVACLNVIAICSVKVRQKVMNKYGQPRDFVNISKNKRAKILDCSPEFLR